METKAADVVFVFPPAYENMGAFRNHLGVSYLRAALARDQISTVQYLNRRPRTVDSVADDVLKHRPGVVGFTVYDTNFALSIALARSIKRKRRGVRVVFGGPSPSFCAPQILTSQPDVDACVVGEAEETGARIVTRLLEPGDLREVPPGLAVRRDGEIVGTALPPLVGAVDSARLPFHSTLDVVPSPYLSGALDDGRTGILTGRGCTHHCQYCCFAALGRKTLRLHSAERVLAELDCIARLQKRHRHRYVVPVHDDAFTLLPARAKALCQAIIDSRLRLTLSCITRADAVDEELLRLMRGAGFVSVAFGLESAVPSVLRAIGKVRPPEWPDPDLEPERQFVERVRSSVITAKRYGFNVGVSIILGLPTETPKDGEATLRFVKGLPIDFYMHNFLVVYPGTPLWATHERYGIACTVDSTGLPLTTDYAYDVADLRPLRRCSLEQEAEVIRTLATDALQGCDASLRTTRGTSIAVLRGGELTRECADWLARILDVGGTLVHVYRGATRAGESPQISHDRRTFFECLVPARYYIQALRAPTRRGDARCMLACASVDFYAAHRPKLVSFTTSDGPGPLLRWLAGTPTECALCDVRDVLRRPSDLRRFVGRAGMGSVGGRLRRMPVPPALEYPGRWLGRRAPCLSLTRIEVDAEGVVRPCRHGEPIGVVGDERRTLRRRLGAIAADAERRRGCGVCSQAACPRCPFPGVDDRTYCTVMRRQRRALRFVAWVHAYSRVPSLLWTERDRVAGD
jgi:radical SAM superfamily enzyme YgiQ (UPF0313 family)